MAIIYTYPQIKSSSDLAASDLMIISDMSANGRPTKSLTLKNLADFVTSTGTGTGTTNAIIKWSDGPAGLLGDSIMTENATQIDLAGTFLSTSSPTATAGPVHAIRANQSTTTGGAFNIALYGDTKHTGATQANSNYGIYTKAEFEGTGGYTGIILGGSFEGRYDGSGTNGANASLYGTFSKARVTAASSGDIEYMIANNVSSEMDSGTTTDVEFLQGQHTNVTFNSGNVSGDIAVNILDFDYTAGTLQGDFAYLQIQNDPVPTPVSGTARAINSDSTLPSHFSGDVEIPLIPTANAHATSKQYVDQQIASIPAGLVFQGNWNASTNTPTLASGTGTVGNYYVVSVAGNTDLDGITDWEVGDWAVFVEVGGVDKWDKIDQTFVQGAGATGQVSFWNGVNSVTGDNDLYWDNSNKRLGIGTTSPGYNLHVKKSGTNSAITIEGSTNSGANFSSRLNFSNKDISGNDIDFTIGLKKTNNFVFMGDAAANELMRIQGNTGNVGIGTSSPSDKLEIDGGSGNAFIQITTPNANYAGIKFGDPQAATAGRIQYYHGDNSMQFDTSGKFAFQGGNVGIGTDNPSERLSLPDNDIIGLGDSADLQIQHNSTDSFIENNTGNLFISNFANDKDIRFATDDGSGGTTTYFFLDGSAASGTYLYTNFPDNSILSLGNASDLLIYHDSTNSQIFNKVGDLVIRNDQNDGDIEFLCDDGSGGVTEYFKLDGGDVKIRFSKTIQLGDNVYFYLGGQQDLGMFHNGTSTFINNNTGDLIIKNSANDKDIIFQSDDGSGGIATYMIIDGGTTQTKFEKNTKHLDSVKAIFGASNDLQIYHDGSNSIIQDSGTGSLKILAQDFTLRNAADNASMITGIDGGSVFLYHAGNTKLETTSTGTKTTGQMDLAALNTPVTNSDDNGTPGEIRFTADYIYVCVADDTWKRVALSTW